jgi:hypothetical protein
MVTYMLESLRSAISNILGKLTGCDATIYKRSNKNMATDDINLNGPSTNNYTTTGWTYVPGSTVKISTGAGGGGGSSWYVGNGTSTITVPNTLGAGTFTYSVAPSYSNGIAVDKNADIKIGDQSLKEFMQTVSDRLAILTPDPVKLEKFAALKAAYDHYKMLEALINEDDDKTQ